MRMDLGRELTPQERHYLALAEIALGPLPEDAPLKPRRDLSLIKKTSAA
jgi:hypothetical protein